MLTDALSSAVWRGAWLVVLLGLPMAAPADTLTEDRVKAGFVFNFMKYAEWPASALGKAELRVCSLSHEALSGELLQLQGRQVQGHGIKVRALARPEEWRECHVLFVPASEQDQVATVLRAVAQSPVLTVSDSANFVGSGGIIGMKLSAGRIRFDIDLVAARRVGLTLSSQLLRLADEVRQ